ncbi:MAG: [LysW]-aminoadipate/[LysW]-glutamate kinase [Candidatus Jordarchaeaceae archaeon]
MIVTIKIGGAMLNKETGNLIADLNKLIKEHKIVIVHGGGPQINEISKKLGKEPVFVTSPSGFRSRFTDKETRDISIMVMAGKINKSIVALLQKNQIPAIGLTGLDGKMLVAERKDKIIAVENGKKRVIRGDYSGKIVEVNGTLLNLIIEKGYIPVIAPIGISHENEPVNLDGDRAAAHIAKAVNADLFVSLTDVQGVIIDGEVVHNINRQEAEEYLKKVKGGMRKKIFAALEALDLGIKPVVICSGLEKDPISSALTLKTGTVIK